MLVTRKVVQRSYCLFWADWEGAVMSIRSNLCAPPMVSSCFYCFLRSSRRLRSSRHLARSQ